MNIRRHRPPNMLAVALLAAAAFCGCGQAANHQDGPTLRMPGELAGEVIHVDDGDTLTLLDADNFKRVVRLTDIDAPESSHGTQQSGQPYSGRATALLKSITLNRQVTATCYDIDARRRNDGTTRERYICRVFVAGIDANMAMLDAGMAMAYRQHPRYVRDKASFAHEDAARSRRIGLWSQTAPIPPWEWRKACWIRQQCDGAGN